MAYETRKGRLYYYSAHWEDGRCVKRYHGSGGAARAAADMVAARGQQRVLDGLAALRFSESIDAAERLYAEVSQRAGQLMELSLLADNCYQASHTWRRRRR